MGLWHYTNFKKLTYFCFVQDYNFNTLETPVLPAVFQKMFPYNVSESLNVQIALLQNWREIVVYSRSLTADQRIRRFLSVSLCIYTLQYLYLHEREKPNPTMRTGKLQFIANAKVWARISLGKYQFTDIFLSLIQETSTEHF